MSISLAKKRRTSAPPKVSKNQEFFNPLKHPKPDTVKVTKPPKLPRTP